MAFLSLKTLIKPEKNRLTATDSEIKINYVNKNTGVFIMAARRHRRYVYRKRQQNKMAMILVTVVFLIMFTVVGIKSIEMKKRVSELSSRESELTEEIKQEQARSDELDQYEKYTQTKKYVEDVAKDKLGLVHDGEIIFKESDK